MQRTEREFTIMEKIDTLDEIIDMVCDLYNEPIREEFKTGSRAAQLGHDVVKRLSERDYINRYQEIGYRVQTMIKERGMIRQGTYDDQRSLDTQEGGSRC